MAEVEKPSSTRDGDGCPHLFSEEEYAADIQFLKQQMAELITLPRKRQWKARAPRRDEIGELLEDLVWTADVKLPLDLFARLLKLISWVMDRPWSREEIRYWRWHFVHASIKAGRKRKQAYADAKEYLEGTPADCGIEMIKKDYDAVERECPF